MREINGCGILRCRASAVMLLAALAHLFAAKIGLGQTDTLRVSALQSNGWVRISGIQSNYSLITVEASSNLVHWKTIAVLHDLSFEFADPVSATMPCRFYRYTADPLDVYSFVGGKNQIKAPWDEFMFGVAGRWVKFAVLMDDPTRVYYADGASYLFHYDFATAQLAPFIGMDEQSFDQISLYNSGRKIMLGAVLFPANENIQEFAVQFVSQDPLPRELVRDLMELVASTVASDTPFRPFYMPTFEQFAAAEADRRWYATNGMSLSSPERWATENASYSDGWTLGRLKFFTAGEVEAAYADGRLLPQDILLIDVVPAELPYVAGIITMSPATPNSHVVILAQSYDVPMAYVWGEADRERLLGLVGQEIVYFSDLTVFPLDPGLDPKLKAELLAAKRPPPIRIAPVARMGSYTAPTDNLYPADVRYFGGKAANYGLLRRTIPSNAPPAIAISFDLWIEFMAQTLGTGRTLREEISNRLAGLTYPAHIPAIKAALPGIRDLIRQNTEFSAAQREAILGALGVFDSRRNIRFRSSTNVEDTETFSGAGLYDSYSGCLDDDLDSDNRGPSCCDLTEENERGVFRAIRRVYASFYNDNAYLERLRHGVNENEVGMALLVHHSIPDDMEMANGVATVSAEEVSPLFYASLVTQAGAVPVANPDQSSWPERATAQQETLGDNITAWLTQSSSLVPIGGHVMEWDDDYRNLAALLFAVTRAYQEMTAKTGVLILDFEYKKVKPGWLEVKQVREIPTFTPSPEEVPAILLNLPVTFVPYQGYNEDGPFPNHRLKSRWTLQTRSGRLTGSNLTSSPYTELTIEHINGDRIETLSGPVQMFRNYSNTVAVTQQFENRVFKSVDSWEMGSGEGLAGVELVTELNVLAGPGYLIKTSADSGLTLTARYDHPVIYNHHSRGLATRTNDVILLELAPRATPEDYVVNSTFTFAAEEMKVTITTSYIHGPSMVHGLRTRIEGMTTQPIELTNYFSQTIDLGHLGAGAQFVFEPRLEPGLSREIVSELESRDIRLLYLRQPSFNPVLLLRGRDGTFRTFAWGERE